MTGADRRASREDPSHAGDRGDSAPDARAHRSAQLALLAFLAVEGTALVLLLVYGANQWFTLDEWDFLAGRETTDLDDLFRPHNEHWVTLPIVLYRVLWELVGLRTYLPYQAMIILLHLGTAGLLRVVMRRVGVGPWIATVAASLFAVFGSGDVNLLWAVQVTEVGSLFFGLAHLLLADHDGPVDRRDRLGIVAGLAGLMSSGIGVSMVVIVGLAVLVRRGWRIAALHTVPLGMCFVLWWLAFARGEYEPIDYSLGSVPRFVVTGIDGALDALGQAPGAGIALGVMLVGGLVLAWRRLEPSELRTRAAAPGAMVVGAVVMLGISGLGRSVYGPNFARQGRWSHLVAALLLPAIAVAADAVGRRWRVLYPVVVGLLLIGVPGNVDAIVDYDRRNAFLRGDEKLILALPRVPVAHEVPRSVRPLPRSAREVTIGWLLDGVASGLVPDPGQIDPGTAARATFRLSLTQTDEPHPFGACRTLGASQQRRLEKGQALRFEGGAIRVSAAGDLAQPFNVLTYDPAEGKTLLALAGPLTVSLAPADPAQPVELCG